MLTNPVNRVVRELRRAALRPDTAERSDGELLDWFLTDRGEAAIEELLRRHGPMVLSVCRRILRHAHDAEDAFQATFLILVRKATSIHKRDVLGAWLYGVAYRVALRVKTMNAKRRLRENEVGERHARA